MFWIHAVSIFLLAVASFYAGMRYGSRGLNAVKMELALIEKEISHDSAVVKTRVYYILDRIKSKL